MDKLTKKEKMTVQRQQLKENKYENEYIKQFIEEFGLSEEEADAYWYMVGAQIITNKIAEIINATKNECYEK